MQSIWLPKKTKFRKLHKGLVKKITYKTQTTELVFGAYGIKILKSGRLHSKQLETARRIISRFIRKKDQLWIRTKATIQVTKKPDEIRMGKGKGQLDKWILRGNAGKVLFELSYMRYTKAYAVFTAVSKRLSIPICLVKIRRPTHFKTLKYFNRSIKYDPKKRKRY